MVGTLWWPRAGSHAARIVAYLETHPEGVDDDQLSRALDITPRQAVNQVCRTLERRGLISRRRDLRLGKIVNQMAISATAHPAQAVPTAADDVVAEPATTSQTLPTTVPAEGTPIVSRFVQLSSETALRQFAYSGESNLSEDRLKEAIRVAMEAEGWQVDVRWGRAHGIDIDARRGDERMVIEAKGEGSRDAMRVNYFLGALGELLQRMDSPDSGYGLAIPAHRQFVGLIVRLPAWVRTHLHLRFMLVRPISSDQFEVGVVTPELTATSSQQAS